MGFPSINHIKIGVALFVILGNPNLEMSSCTNHGPHSDLTVVPPGLLAHSQPPAQGLCRLQTPDVAGRRQGGPSDICLVAVHSKNHGT